MALQNKRPKWSLILDEELRGVRLIIWGCPGANRGCPGANRECPGANRGCPGANRPLTSQKNCLSPYSIRSYCGPLSVRGVFSKMWTFVGTNGRSRWIVPICLLPYGSPTVGWCWNRFVLVGCNFRRHNSLAVNRTGFLNSLRECELWNAVPMRIE